MAHYPTTDILHVFEAKPRRAEVHRVEGEQRKKFRTVCVYDGHVLIPEYYVNETNAIDAAKRYVFRNP